MTHIQSLSKIGQRLAFAGFVVAVVLAVSAWLEVAHAAELPVRVTRNAEDIFTCQALGVVRSNPPYLTRNADIRDIQTQAMALGADTVLITARMISTVGVAYRCAK